MHLSEKAKIKNQKELCEKELMGRNGGGKV
jgi:hypothetical protein